jgi:hypothetical protein
MYFPDVPQSNSLGSVQPPLNRFWAHETYARADFAGSYHFDLQRSLASPPGLHENNRKLKDSKILCFNQHVIAPRVQPVKCELAVITSLDGEQFRFSLTNCHSCTRDRRTRLVNHNSTDALNRFDSRLAADYFRCA